MYIHFLVPEMAKKYLLGVGNFARKVVLLMLYLVKVYTKIIKYVIKA
jgi:hypothetical protein